MSKLSPPTLRPHVKVEDTLANLIKRSRPGERLPAEPALAAQLGVSRAKLREMLRSFEERGVIVRRHGAGTFIAPPRPALEAGLEVLESFDCIAGRAGLKTHVGAVAIEERPARPDELKGLNLNAATLVLSITRIILVKAQPVAYLVDLVPREYLEKNNLETSFNGSVLELFLRLGQPAPAYSRTNLIATVADTALARLLQIQRGAPLLKLEAQLYNPDNQIIDYSTGCFVPGYFNFHVIRRISA